MTALKMRVLAVTLHEREAVLRLPFRFGVATLRAAPLAFLRVRIAVDGGREAEGFASELMAPKWFDKSPARSNDDNFDQLRLALALTAQAYAAEGPKTPFGLAMGVAPDLWRAGEAHGLPGLALGFGPALLDRAILDALCRSLDLSIFQAVTADVPGVASAPLPADLAGFDMADFTSGLRPAASLAARHTIGMSDPITATDAHEPVNDGLPETLEQVIATYGHNHFKVKVRGEIAEDLDRLTAIARVLDSRTAPYALTLDGNEQYREVVQIEELLAVLDGTPSLRRFAQSILFLEQPLARAVALERDVRSLAVRIPILIDESDANLDAFRLARARGYTGVSSKDCKGVYRSLLNAARCVAWSAEGGPTYFLSAEDLTCPSGLAVQQDLALAAMIGVSHVERNGHHYIAGIPAAPEDEQQAFLAAHPDLYERQGDRVQLRIQKGRLSLGSLSASGFGSACAPILTNGVPLA